MLSAGVKFIPNMATGVEENLEKTSENLDWTNFPVNTATRCTSARDCMWASVQMSRSVETCIRGCHSFSFSNTQDTLNIVTGSVLEHEQDGEPVKMRDVEGLADGDLEH